MDLGTIKHRLLHGKIRTPAQFASEVRMVWRNALIYHQPEAYVLKLAAKLERKFEELFSARLSLHDRRVHDLSEEEDEEIEALQVAFQAIVQGSSKPV